MESRSDKEDLSEKLRKVASTNSNSVHIVPSRDGWSVRREGADRSTVVKATEDEAIKAARELKSTERIIIHNKDGTIARNL
jgi:threonine synthase